MKERSVVQNPDATQERSEREDSLNFRVVMQIFARTFPLVASVKWHLALFVGATVVLTLGGVSLVFPFFDALWNGTLAGEAISPWTATLLQLLLPLSER